MSRFVSNTTTQVEVTAGFTLAELRGAVNAIADSSAPIPPKPTPAPVTVAEPAPEVRRVFTSRVIRWRDVQGVSQVADQFVDADLTPSAASRGLRCGAVTRVDDPRRRELLFFATTNVALKMRRPTSQH